MESKPAINSSYDKHRKGYAAYATNDDDDDDDGEINSNDDTATKHNSNNSEAYHCLISGTHYATSLSKKYNAVIAINHRNKDCHKDNILDKDNSNNNNNETLLETYKSQKPELNSPNLEPDKTTSYSSSSSLSSLMPSDICSSNESDTATSTVTSPRRRISPQNRFSDIRTNKNETNLSQDFDEQDETASKYSVINSTSNSTLKQHSTLLLNAKTVMDSIKFSHIYTPSKQPYQRLSTEEWYRNISGEKSSTLLGISRRLLDVISLIVATLIVAMLCIIYIKTYTNEEINYLGSTRTNSRLGTYSNYALSTDASPCAPVGAKLLDKGGSAVDSAIGTLLCMGLVIPNSMGLGGGCLMTIYNRTERKASIIDGREEAPHYAYEKMFGANDLAASRGPLSVGVPGELAAYYEAHKQYGRLNWSDLFEDTIRMAEEGVPLVEHMDYAMHNNAHAQHMRPSLRELFTNPKTGELYRQGEVVKRPDLAKTLRRIRDHGIEEFYGGGETGRLFIEDLKNQGGNMTFEDLENYKVRTDNEAITTKLADDLIMYTQPVPGSGSILSLIMRIMGRLGYYGKHDVKDSFQKSSLYYHHLVEAFKFSYAQRAGLEDYSKGDNTRLDNLIKDLESEEFLNKVVSKVGNETHSVDYYGGTEYFSDDHGTAHVSVIDKEGNSIAVTTSVNLYFGAGLLSESTGLIYNDIMDDFVSPGFKNKFELPPSKYNRIEKGKRPLSSMVPSIFTNDRGDVRLSIGASGGSKITTSVASVCLRHLYLGEDIKTAIDAPRIHHQLIPNNITYEPLFPENLLDSLKARKHTVSKLKGRSSVVMAVASNVTLDNGSNTLLVVGSALTKSSNQMITANSDYRKGGAVEGN